MFPKHACKFPNFYQCSTNCFVGIKVLFLAQTAAVADVTGTPTEFGICQTSTFAHVASKGDKLLLAVMRRKTGHFPMSVSGSASKQPCFFLESLEPMWIEQQFLGD
jgi:hypothetical protein